MRYCSRCVHGDWSVMQETSRVAGRVLPRPLFSALRRLGTALLTPLRFSLATGHFRSSLAARAVDRVGNPIPWYTYRAVSLLANVSFDDRRVLEFGAGQSRLWWAKHAREMLALESDAQWVRRLQERLPHNVRLAQVADDAHGIGKHLGSDPFDVIIIPAFG